MAGSIESRKRSPPIVRLSNSDLLDLAIWDIKLAALKL
jgi:hypothetical protein